MALTNSPGVRGLTATPRDNRRAWEAALREPGVIGPIGGIVVTGTSDVSPPVYQVEANFFATRRTSTDGLNVWSVDAPEPVTMPTAPGSGSRIDIIYALHHDDDPPHSDGDYLPTLGVVSGTPSGGTPTPPSLPAGAIELARATVPSGATSTNATTISHANTTRAADLYTGSALFTSMASGVAVGSGDALVTPDGIAYVVLDVTGLTLAAGGQNVLIGNLIPALRPALLLPVTGFFANGAVTATISPSSLEFRARWCSEATTGRTYYAASYRTA